MKHFPETLSNATQALHTNHIQWFHLGMPIAGPDANALQQDNLGADIANSVICPWNKKLWGFLKCTTLLK